MMLWDGTLLCATVQWVCLRCPCASMRITWAVDESTVLQGGNVWEKAGVNVSVVYGSMPASAYRAATERAQDISPDAGRVPFFAAGISSVMHPHNPHAPTMHFNYRYAIHLQDWLVLMSCTYSWSGAHVCDRA